MKSDVTIKRVSEQIRDAVENGSNSAIIVGGNLVDLANEKINRHSFRKKQPKPILSFRFDDGTEQQHDWFTYFQNTDKFPSGAVPATCVINARFIGTGNNITAAHILEMHAGGWEIGSHGWCHATNPPHGACVRECYGCCDTDSPGTPGTGFLNGAESGDPCPVCTLGGLFPLSTQDEAGRTNGWCYMPYWYKFDTDDPTGLIDYAEKALDEECRWSKEALETIIQEVDPTYECKTLTPPGYSAQSVIARSIASKYYESSCGGGIAAGTNQREAKVFDQYALSAICIDLPGDWLYTTEGALDNIKAELDLCVAENAWLTILSHSSYDGAIDGPKSTFFRAVVAYARSIGVEIMTISDALDAMGSYAVIGSGFNVNEHGAAIRRLGGDAAKVSDAAVCIGIEAGYNASTLENNVIIGYQAGYALAQAATANAVIIGSQAGNGTAGEAANMVAIGGQAGSSGRALGSISIGYQSGKSCSASHRVAIGYQAMLSATNSTNGVAIGYRAGNTNSGTNPIFIGYNMGKDNTEDDVFLLGQGSVSATPLIKGYFATGGIVLGAPNAAVADANMGNSRVNFWLTEGETPTLNFRVKGATGTMYDGTVSLTPEV